MQELGKEHSVKAFNFKRQYPDILFPGKTQYVTKDDNAVPVESEALLDTANPFTYISTAKAIRRFNPDLLIMRYWMSHWVMLQDMLEETARLFPSWIMLFRMSRISLTVCLPNGS